MDTPFIIVSIDGPAGTVASAINVAAAEAEHRHATLRLVGTCAPGDVAVTERFVAALATCVGGVHPHIALDTAVLPGGPGQALMDAAPGAELVVVAGDARIHYGGIPGGHLAAYAAAHAPVPVLVVPPPGSDRVRDKRVVVGVDGGPSSSDTIGFAFDEAAARGATLHAVTVWDRPARHGVRPIAPAADPLPLRVAALRALDEVLEPWCEKYPDVPVVRDVVRASNPTQALCEAAGDAELLVVGGRGRGGYVTRLLGTVAASLVHFTPTTLAVVRVTPDGAK